jgi:hypothetical protein
VNPGCYGCGAPVPDDVLYCELCCTSVEGRYDLDGLTRNLAALALLADADRLPWMNPAGAHRRYTAARIGFGDNWRTAIADAVRRWGTP